MAEQADMTEDAAPDPQIIAPEAGKPLSKSEAVDSIADLLGPDPETDTGDKTAKEDEDQASKDPLGDDDEDVATASDDKDEDASSEDSAGKFVSATAKYKLADGTVISIGDLARNNLFQRDYSKKTEEVAREREVITTKSKEVDQLSQQLKAEREYVIWFAQTYAPKPPSPPTVPATQDPIAHLEYQDAIQRYNMFAENYRQFVTEQKADGERKAGETLKQQQEREAGEVRALMDKLPFLKDEKKAAPFFTEVASQAKEHYGLSETDIANAAKSDHRTMLILRDALRYRKAQKAAPKVQEQLARVPKMVRTPTARTAPNQQANRVRQQTGEKLRQDGSLRNGIAAIEALLS